MILKTCSRRKRWTMLLLMTTFTVMANDESCTAQKGKSQKNSTVVKDSKHYIPFEALDLLIHADKKGVFLSQSEYEKLRNLAKRNSRTVLETPRESFFSKVEYTALPVGNQLKISASFTLEQFREGWQTIALPFRHLSVESATIDGQNAHLGKDPQTGKLMLLNRETGKHALTFQLVTPLHTASSDQVAAVGFPQVPEGTFSIRLPQGKHLVVNDALVERPNPIEQPTLYRLPVGGQNEIVLRMTDRMTGRLSDPLVFLNSELNHRVRVGEILWNANSHLQVFGQPLDTLQFQVPKTLEITDVSATGLESWKLEDAPDNDKRFAISLRFRSAFAGSRDIRFRGVLNPGEEHDWSVPTLTLKGVTNHIGTVKIEVPRGIQLQIDDQEGLRSIPAVSKIRQPTATKNWQYAFWRDDFSMDVITAKRARQVISEQLTSLAIGEEKAQLEFHATVTAYQSPLFELDVLLSAAWTVEKVTLNNRPADWRKLPQQAGIHTLRIRSLSPSQPIKRPAGGAFAKTQKLELKFSASRTLENLRSGKPQEELNLPEIRIVQANAVEGALLIQASPEFLLEVKNLKGLDAASIEKSENVFGYRYRDSRISGLLSIISKPSRYSAETMNFVRLAASRLETFFVSSLEIRGSGKRSLDVSLPQTLGNQLQFHLLQSNVRIVEQKVVSTANGINLWRLRFDRKLNGNAELIVRGTVSGAAADALWTLPRIDFPNAIRQTGYVVVEGQPQQRLNVTATYRNISTSKKTKKKSQTEQPLESVLPIDLPAIPVSQGRPVYRLKDRIVAAYSYLQPNYAIGLEEERFPLTGVPTAVCSKSHIVSLLSETATIQHEAKFSLLMSGIAEVRFELPPGTELWAALWNGQPVEVRESGSAFAVVTPTKSSANKTDSLTVFYSSQPEEGLFSQPIEETPPRLFAYAADGTLRPFPILEQEWVVKHPADFRLTSSRGEFVPRQTLGSSVLAESLSRYFVRPSVGRIGWSISILLVVFILGALMVLLKKHHRFARQVGVFSIMMVVVVAIYFIFLSTFSGNKSELSNSEHYAKSVKKSAMTLDKAKEKNLMAEGEFRGGGGGNFEPKMGPETRASNRRFAPRTTVPLTAGAAGGKKNPQGLPQSVAPPRGRTGEEPRGQSDGDVLDGPIDWDKSGLRNGALLSVPIEMVVPVGNVQQSFRYSGNKTESKDQPKLSFTYRRESSVWTAIMLIVAGTMFLFWMLRKRSLQFRVKFFTVLFCASLALQPVIVASWKPLLEGLILGLFAGLVVWGMNSLLLSLLKLTSLPQTAASKMTTTVLLLLAGTICTTASAQQRNPSRVERQVKKTEPRIVIPYDAKTDPLKAERIYLPQQDFLELWNLAHPDKKVLPSSPVESVIAAVLVDGKLAAASSNGSTDKVSFHARLAIYSYRDTQVLVPIPLRGIAIQKATLDGKTAPLVGLVAKRKKTTGSPTLNVLLNRAGLHLLDLDFDVPARLSRSSGSFSLELLPIAAGRLSFELPSLDTEAKVAGAVDTFRIQKKENRRILELPLDRKGVVDVSWQPHRNQTEIQRVVRSTAETKIVVSDKGVVRKTHLDISVRLGSAMNLSFVIPTDERLQKIAGPDLAGWEMDDRNGLRTVKVFMRRPVEAKTSLDIELFRPLAIEDNSTQIDVKQLAPKESAHAVETVVILAEKFFYVSVNRTNAVRQIGIETLQKNPWYRSANRSLRMAYRMTSSDASVRLSINRKKGALHVNGYHAVSIERRKLRISSFLTVLLERRVLNRIEILLPEEFLLLNVNAIGLSDWSLSEDKTVLYLDFDDAGRRITDISILGLLNRTEEMEPLDLAIPVPMEATRMETQLGVWLSPELSGTVESSDDWRAVPPDSLYAKLRARRKSRPAFAFHSSKVELFPVSMKVEKKTPSVKANSATIVTVQENAVDYHLLLKWHVKTAGLQRFVFSTSKWLADKLVFDRYSVQKMEHPTEPDSRVLWVVRTSEKLIGNIAIVGTASLPALIGKNLGVRSPFVEFENSIDFAPNEEPKPLATQNHFLVLTNKSRNQLSAVSGGDSLRRLSATQFQSLGDNSVSIPQEILESSMEILRLEPEVTLPRWRAQRFQTKETSQAAVTLADLTTVLEWDGSWRTKAVYHVKNRAKQFLALRLPLGAKILSVHVKKQAAKLVSIEREGKTIYLIPLPKVSAAEFSLPVKIIVAGELAEGLPKNREIRSREIGIPVPHVLEESTSEFGIPVSQTRWSVYLPKDISASQLNDANRSNMTQINHDEFRSIEDLDRLSQANEMFSVLQEKGKFQQQTKAMGNIEKIQQKFSGKPSFKDKFHKGFTEQSDLQRRLAIERDKFQRNLKGLKGQLELKASDLPSQLKEFTQRESSLQEKERSSRQNGAKSLSSSNTRFSSPAEISQQQQESFQFPITKLIPSGRQPRQGKPGKFGESGQQRGTRSSLERFRSESGKRLEEKLQQQPKNFKNRTDKKRLQQKAEDRESRPARELMRPNPDDAKNKNRELTDADILGENVSDWTRNTGLALDFEIPTGGQLLTFSKIAGEPKLILKMRSRTQTGRWYGWVWFGFWTLAGIFIVRSMGKIDSVEILQRAISFLFISLGIAGVFLLRIPYNAIGFVVLFSAIVTFLKVRQKGLKASPISKT